MSAVLAYAGAAVVTAWGMAHAAPVRAVVAGFAPISLDNRRILAMEWLAEALTLVFVGGLTVAVTASGHGPTVAVMQRAVAGGLAAMAVLHASLGARTAVRPMQVCPFVLGGGAALILAASLV